MKSSRTQARAVWISGVWELMIVCRTFIFHICAFWLQNFLTTRPDQSRPVPVPDLFCKYPTRPVPKSSERKILSGAAVRAGRWRELFLPVSRLRTALSRLPSHSSISSLHNAITLYVLRTLNKNINHSECNIFIGKTLFPIFISKMIPSSWNS